MNTQSRPAEPINARPGWDMRAWRVGLIASNSLGLIVGLCLEHGIQVWSKKYAGELHNTIGAIAVILAMVVLPGILAGIARRRWLLWAYLPVVTMLAWMIAVFTLDSFLKAIGTTPSSSTSDRDELIGMIIFFSAPLTTALPVTLVRLRIAAKRARRAAMRAFEAAQYTIERVGVWPPPPTQASEDAPAPETSGINHYC